MAYELGIGWDAILSYRFLNMAEFGPTDDVSLHLFEVGLGKKLLSYFGNYIPLTKSARPFCISIVE